MILRRAPMFLGLLLLACGPKDPPKQASIPDQGDPLGESSPTPPMAKPSDSAAPAAAGGKPAVGHGGQPPQVGSLAGYMDGVKWGVSHAELTKQYTDTGGVIWRDYDEKLRKARVGPEQTALEAERESVKAAFARSWTEFKDTPTGLDTTGLRGEYSYRNKEGLMSISRKGKKRYFFFINDRLWKVYDEIPLADGGAMGANFLEAVNTINAQLNAQGHPVAANPEKGVYAPTVEWKDATSHMRAIDRSGERVLGLAVEESATASNIAALRPNKLPDPMEIDPSVLAVTKNRPSDPNAAPSASAAGSASGGKTKPPATAPKKK